MVMIPPRPERQLVTRIYAAIERRETKPEVYLGRLGSSFIGEECIRKIWLDWRGFAREQFEGRMLRLFETGHQQEARIVEDLRNAGLDVWAVREDGSQYEFVDETGHFITKMDGVVKGVPESEKTAHALEVKTHNKNSFNAVAKKGAYEAKPLHYAQTQITMSVAGLTRTLYVSLCKDDEQFYIERIKEDKTEQAKLHKKIATMVQARMRPAGISDDGSSFGCKYCGMKSVCTKETPPLRHCRTCINAVPIEHGEWKCELHNLLLDKPSQLAACADYEAL